jgi:hypothetical protein
MPQRATSLMDVDLPPAGVTSVIVIAALSVIALIIRMIGPWRKQLDDLEGRMRAELRLERKRCDVELRLLRHRSARSRQMIYDLLHLFDIPAARRKAMLASIREEIATIERAEAEEWAIAIAAIDEIEE